MPSVAHLEAVLVAAENHLARGTALLRRQMNLIDRLSADGHDTRLARELLATMVGVGRSMHSDVARIKQEIAEAQAWSTASGNSATSQASV